MNCLQYKIRFHLILVRIQIQIVFMKPVNEYLHRIYGDMCINNGDMHFLLQASFWPFKAMERVFEEEFGKDVTAM